METPNTEAKPDAKPAAKPVEAKPETDDKGEKGSNFLDFSKYPEEIRAEIEPRFKRLYGHVKSNERTLANALKGVGELRKHALAMEEEVTRLRSERDQDKKGDAVSDLKHRMKKAAEDGDFDLHTDLSEKLAEIKAERNTKPEPKPKGEPLADAVENAGASLTNDEETSIASWANAKGRDGKPLRPWTQDGHPLRDKAANLVNAVLADPEYAEAPIEDVLRTVDQLMIGTSRRGQPAVLDPNGSRPKVDPPMQLSASEKYAATHLYPDLDEKEAHARYAKSKKSLRKEGT